MIKEPQLEDAQAMSLTNSKTFNLPTNERISQLKIDDLVKVNASGERFWVKIVNIDSSQNKIFGIIDNDLVRTDQHGLKFKDTLILFPHNIYQIY